MKDEDKGNDKKASCETEKAIRTSNGSVRRITKYRNTNKGEET